MVHKLRGKIDSEGEFTVDAKIISDYVSLLKQDKVDVENIDGEISLSCDNYNTKIKIQDAKDFPLIPVVEKNQEIKISLNDFREALGQVIFAVSNSEIRVELSGVLFSFFGSVLTLAATDSYRLAEKEIFIKSLDKNLDTKVIVPAKTLQELLRIISGLKDNSNIDSDGNIQIYLSENQILFSFGSTELVSRLIIGSYPDYKPIIPIEFQTEVNFNKQEFSRAIKAAAIFSKTDINEVSLVFDKDNGEIIISSASSQSGESSIKLAAEISGESNNIVINHRFLLDGMKNINGDTLSLKLVNSNTPCILSAKTLDKYLYVVMPIRQ